MAPLQLGLPLLAQTSSYVTATCHSPSTFRIARSSNRHSFWRRWLASQRWRRWRGVPGRVPAGRHPWGVV